MLHTCVQSERIPYDDNGECDSLVAQVWPAVRQFGRSRTKLPRAVKKCWIDCKGSAYLIQNVM